MDHDDSFEINKTPAALIRKAQPEDSASWLRLRRLLWPKCSDHKHHLEMDQLLKSKGALFVAEDRRKMLVGFAEVSLRHDHVDGASVSPVPYLEAWFVEEAYRKQGIGRSLVGAVEHWTISNGYCELASDAEIENSLSIRLHKLSGFTELDRNVTFLKTLAARTDESAKPIDRTLADSSIRSDKVPAGEDLPSLSRRSVSADILEHNRKAWNLESKSGSRWCQPVTRDEIESARRGSWSVILTPNKRVPFSWFGDVKGKKVLCLASGGGQQAPILAAAGAVVTSFDNSQEQLAKDRFVAERDSLAIKTVPGDMADLSVFEDQSFDLVFHPSANGYAENLTPVWQECFRVLKWNGSLLSGFLNPLYFLFDHDEAARTGVLEVKYSQPYSDLKSLPEEKREKLAKAGLAYEFGHTLEQQIGGQLAAGFVIYEMYEDRWDGQATPLDRFTSTSISTLARKIRRE